jgi:hypothetical protein
LRLRNRPLDLWLLTELIALHFRRPIRVHGPGRWLIYLGPGRRLICRCVRFLLPPEAPIHRRSLLIALRPDHIGLIHRGVRILLLPESPIHRRSLLIRIHLPEPPARRRRSGG